MILGLIWGLSGAYLGLFELIGAYLVLIWCLFGAYMGLFGAYLGLFVTKTTSHDQPFKFIFSRMIGIILLKTR